MRISYLKELTYLWSLLLNKKSKKELEEGDYLNVQFFDEEISDPEIRKALNLKLSNMCNQYNVHVSNLWWDNKKLTYRIEKLENLNPI